MPSCFGVGSCSSYRLLILPPATPAAAATGADKYEGADMRVDSHWSEKSLDQMTDRDWRIFRCAPCLAACLPACLLPLMLPTLPPDDAAGQPAPLGNLDCRLLLLLLRSPSA